jgi:hypothetical protein
VTPRISSSECVSPASALQTTSEEGTQIISDNVSTVTTMLPIPPVNLVIVPNPDIVGKVVNSPIVDGMDWKRVQLIADMLGAFYFN